MKLRKVKYRGKDGFFHQFGSSIAEPVASPDLQYTVAIVEDAIDGKVHLVHPEDLKFEERPPLEDYMTHGQALEQAMKEF